MSRKSRLAKQILEQEKRSSKNWKKQKYKKMKEEGLLGQRDILNYNDILEDLVNSSCPSEMLSKYRGICSPKKKSL